MKSLENILACLMGYEVALSSDKLEKEKRKSNWNEHKYGWMIKNGVIVINPEEDEKVKLLKQDFAKMIKYKKDNKLIKPKVEKRRESFNDKKKKLDLMKPYPRKLMQGSPVLPIS